MTKEQQPIELTTKPVDPTLNVRGNIFMPEGTNGGPEQGAPQKIRPEETVDRLAQVKKNAEAERQSALDRILSATDIPVSIKRAAEDLVRKNEEDEKKADEEAANSSGGDGGGKKPPITEDDSDSQEPEDRIEAMSASEVAKEIRDTLNELPREKREQYEVELRDLKDKSPKERVDGLKKVLKGIDEEINNEQTIIEATLEEIQEKRQAEGPDIAQSDSREEIYEAMNNQAGAAVKEVAENIMSRISQLSAATDTESQMNNEQIMGELLNGELMAMIGSLAIGNKKESSLRAKDNIQEIMSLPIAMGEKKDRLIGIVNNVARRYKARVEKHERDVYNPVNSVQDLGKYISETHGADLWGKDGQNPIIDNDGKFHPENMILWVREQTNKMHVDNRNDAISPLGSIHVRIGISDVSLYEMVRINRQRYMKDKDTSAVLDDLAEELIIQAWGFGQVRNFSLAYSQQMTQDDKLPEANNQIHARNDITNGDTLSRLTKMADIYGEDAKAGRAVLFENDFYYNISDWQELVVILGGENVTEELRQKLKTFDSLKIKNELIAEGITDKDELSKRFGEKIVSEFIGDIPTFTKGDFKDAIRILQGKNDWEDIDSYQGFYDAENKDRFYTTEKVGETGEVVQHELFDKDGRFNLINFVRYMNIYNYATPDQSMVNLVKELVRLKSAEKFGLKSGIEREQSGKDAKKAAWEKIIENQEGIGQTRKQAESEANKQLLAIQRHGDRITMEFAEHLAYGFQRPYGGAASNDVNRAGFDARTKLNMEDYLIGQSKAVRAGPVGVRQSVGIYRDLGTDMWTALKTESRESPLEIFRQVRNLENAPKGALKSYYKESGLLSKNFDAQTKEAKDLEIEKLREKQIKDTLDKLRFAERAEIDVAGNIQSRGFNIFHNQTGGERLDLDKAVEYDPFTGPKIHLEYTEKVVNDGEIKDARYFGSTNSGMKFSQEVRRLKGIEMGVPIYEDVSLAEKTYSPEVLTEFVKYAIKKRAGGDTSVPDFSNMKITKGVVDFDNFTEEQRNYIDYGRGRLAMVKVSKALDFGAILAHHRAFRGRAQRWGYVRNEAFFGMLKGMEELEADTDHPGRTRVKIGEDGNPLRFFDEDLMQLMRDRGGVKSWALFLQDAGSEAGGPFLMSLLEALNRFAQTAVKAG